MNMNGRPTRSTRSQAQYHDDGFDVEDDEPDVSQRQPRVKPIRLRMRTAKSSNKSSYEDEDNDAVSRSDSSVLENDGSNIGSSRQRLRSAAMPSLHPSRLSSSDAASLATSSNFTSARANLRRSTRLQNAESASSQDDFMPLHRVKHTAAKVRTESQHTDTAGHSKLVRFDTVEGANAKQKSSLTRSGPDDERMNDDEEEDDDDARIGQRSPLRTSRSGRKVVATYKEDEEDSDEEVIRPKRRAPTGKTSMDGFVVNDDDGDDDADGAFRSNGSRRSSSRLKRASKKVASLAAKRSKRQRRKSQLSSDYEDNEEATMSDEDDEDGDEGEPEEEEESDEAGPRSYSFRRRTKKVDYRLAAPQEPLRDGFGKKIRSRSRSGPSGGGGAYDIDGVDALPTIAGPSKLGRARENWNGLPLSMTGKDYDRYFGTQGGDDSSDDDIPASRKPGAGPTLLGGSSAGGLLGAGGAGGAGGGTSGLGPDLGAGRDAVGRMKGSTELADIDPLGVNMQVDFNSVGGLDDHIQQLKEMVSLPLLYPEVFQRFKVTPPRGVLFHGPPGTGKTLVARALAASCSSSGQQISFFMRKGADCLSKWVGEAERQLRLLFEEAKNAQPSIIFFDEIDGLAPVRSSKQDQIHASIVSTLLALMDGMDGRGQVVVIGATNRPDSVDPALRRPGRFDREFYFPLPNKEARKSIININTKEWDPPLDEAFKERLAEVTKGYGGADLRALCTEAALNAIQRRYPQIYQTTDRLELKPETIHVDARDFMMSVNKVVPSSARSASSAAAPLKEHLQPLLQDAVRDATGSLERVLPPTSKRNPLEEAQWEDDAPVSSDGGFNRELLLQSFEQLRIFRPRLIVHGQKGMGQRYVGSALLHHLEGYHVQTLDAGTLLGDSGTTMEASVVQMFNEAKRHKPSVLYVPSVAQWADTVSESARATFKSLLDGLAPSDPILLVAICEGLFEDLPRDIRSWFGFARENRVHITTPDEQKRKAYFDELLRNITKTPSEFPDGLPRRKRILDTLPKAPPRPPRVPTVAELRAQKDDDDRILNDLKFRLGPVLGELKKKFPRFKRDVWQEYNLYELTQQFNWRKEKNKVIVTLLYEPGSQLLQRLQATTGDEDLLAGPTAASRGVSVELTRDAPSSQPNVQESVAAQTNGATIGEQQVPIQAQAQLEAPSVPTAIVTSDEDQQRMAPDVSLSGLAAAMTGDFSSANPPPINTMPSGSGRFRRGDSGFFERDLPIWTVNLEKMQKRLYYNGYLTVNDFIEDVRRIVSNAEEAQEVDEDRLSRANQLFITANYMADQYFDAEFRLRCDRMAARTVQREAELRKAEEEQKKQKEEAARMPKGERHSSRLHGEQPTSATLDELVALERKRARPSEGASSDVATNLSASDVHSEEMRKRMRPNNDVEVKYNSAGVPDASLAAGQLQGIDWSTPTALEASHESSSFFDQHQQGPTPSSSAPLPLPSYLNGHRASSPLTPGTTSQASHHPFPAAAGSNHSILSPIVKPAGVNTPPLASVSHPPFTCDMSQLRALEQQLLQSTASFSVEQLEQLRASLFTLIWNKRSTWDKAGLMSEMADVVRDITREVDEYNRQEKQDDEAEMTNAAMTFTSTS